MKNNSYNFKNRTAIITGGAQGFGLDIAKRFLNSGAKVIIWDIDPEMVEKSLRDMNNSNLSSNIVDVSNFQEVEHTPFVSVVIAMRNESKHVNRLLEEITNQMYSKKKYEIIIVNDHSTDETLELLHQFKSPLIKVFSLQENEGGKKRAVKKAVSIAKGDIIITTDADCSVKPYWISKIAACFIDKKIKLVAGPVAFYNSNNIFCDLQSLEFSSLIGSKTLPASRP